MTLATALAAMFIRTQVTAPVSRQEVGGTPPAVTVVPASGTGGAGGVAPEPAPATPGG